MATRIGRRRVHFGAYFRLVHSLDSRVLRHFRPRCDIEIRKVAVFRADRIGDAFVCLPLFLQMDKRYELSVFSSPHNDFILKKAGLNTAIYDNPSFYKKDSFAEFVRGIFLFNTVFPLKLLWSRLKGGVPQYDLFLLQDLSPIRQDFIVEADRSARFLSSPFLGHFFLPFANFLSFRRYLITEPKASPVYQYYQGIRYFDPGFCFVPRADALNFLAEEARDAFDIPVERFVVFHVGGKANRLLHDKHVVDFLNRIDVPIAAIDDESRSAMNRLKGQVKNKNVFWIPPSYSLFEYLSLVLDDRCMGYIGYDGGHSHLLSLPKPSVTIYTMGEHEKWRTYTGNPYEKIELRDGISLEYSLLDDTVKGILHRDLACNPCFYQPCSDPVCQAVPLLDCWDPMRRFFSL